MRLFLLNWFLFTFFAADNASSCLFSDMAFRPSLDICILPGPFSEFSSCCKSRNISYIDHGCNCGPNWEAVIAGKTAANVVVLLTWILFLIWMGNRRWNLSWVKKDVLSSSDALGRLTGSSWRQNLRKSMQFGDQFGKTLFNPFGFGLWMLSPVNMGFREMSCRCRVEREPANI